MISVQYSAQPPTHPPPPTHPDFSFKCGHVPRLSMKHKNRLVRVEKVSSEDFLVKPLWGTGGVTGFGPGGYLHLLIDGSIYTIYVVLV